MIQEEIIERLDRIEKLLQKLLTDRIEDSLEMLSLNRACKLLHCGQSKLIKAIKQGEIPAMLSIVGTQKRYKLRASDLRAFQERKVSSPSVELDPDWAKKIIKSTVLKKVE